MSTAPARLLPPGTRRKVTVPGSTSNIGPGFDCIGCAVSLANEFTFTIARDDEDRVDLSGPCVGGIPATSDNLALATARDFLRSRGIDPPKLHLHAEINVPSARGLGSSSTAIVAGLLGANALLQVPLDTPTLLDIAVETEGHPDNVAPAILGGLVVSAAHSRPLVCRKLAVHSTIRFLFVIPDYMVKTSDARNVLPRTLPYRAAIFNLSRTPLLAMALQTGDLRDFREIIKDEIHQPFRAPLYKGFAELSAAAAGAGAAGFCVSGAGPTMLAVCTARDQGPVADALRETMRQLSIRGEIIELQPDNAGSRVTAL